MQAEQWVASVRRPINAVHDARLWCGGGSATSDNVGPLNLINKRVVAYGLRESETVREEALACQPICKIETGIRRAASDQARTSYSPF